MGGGVPRWGPRTTVLLVSITDVNLNIKYTQYSRLNMILLCIHQHICVEPEGVSFYTHVSIIGFTAMYYVTVLCQKIIYSPKLNIYAPSKTSQTAGYYFRFGVCRLVPWGVIPISRGSRKIVSLHSLFPIQVN